MKRLAAIIATVFLASVSVWAQHNSYAIDDECHSWFMKAEQSMDDFESDEFDTAQQMFLETSLRKKDTKAQAIYYVEQLKRTSHLAQHVRSQDPIAWDSQAWNARIEQEKETAQRIARSTGYMQYYYYASELCQTYYYNTTQDVLASEMLMNMMEEARATDDEYALWKTLIYLERLYLRAGDRLHTQRYLLQAVKIFETTADQTIRRQGMTVQFCELADTYPPASDSARIFYRKAEATSRTKLDTLRFTYYKALLAAADGKMDEYRKHRDFCLSFAPFPSQIRSGRQCFDCVDNILAGKPAKSYAGSINALYSLQQMEFTSYLAAMHGQWETAAAIRNRLVERQYLNIFYLNGQRLDYMTAQYENNRLSADLEQAAQKVKRTTILAIVLVALMLSGALVYVLLQRRKKKK